MRNDSQYTPWDSNPIYTLRLVLTIKTNRFNRIHLSRNN